ncbi:excalibur calcium-binding domain-containing protein [Streptomyces sp. AP-93]|uniref:excalibur calcium-binding domain-containing protein n=1 Tax=Streptomyces sp. AP-93 TaxID=2929048 RepID=UPI001FAE9ED9|nr:excalibur calcium-binding domain-containing protein [Streptomyces sp. AP-93]MCJ0869015.1 excalibur calcium-binding domain-containing protein [Streptomyces sp. AP-93]
MTAMTGAVVLSLAGCGGTATTSSDKPGSTPVMPALVGKPAFEAENLVNKLLTKPVEVRSAYSDVELPTVHLVWRVCFQTPAAGAPLPSGSAAEISLTDTVTPCPEKAGAALKRPASTPAPPQTPGSGKTPAPAATGKAKPPASSPTPAPAPKDTYYKNCAEAKAAGAAPIRRGQPGYGKHLDRDNDGIACDK